MTKVIRPPQPFGCRRPPPPPTSSMEPFDDELAKRLQLHAIADEELRGVLAPGDIRHVRPSFRLYTPDFRRPSRTTSARDASTAEWRIRWILARAQDAQHLSLSALLSALGGPLLCRNNDPLKSLVAFFIGRAVHYRIMAAYRSVYRDHRIACDNRVFFPDRSSERLSVLAQKDTRSVYGGLNYCLAGQRCDIINIDRPEMWEIKPAGLTSAALLQLWGYLDNYEVARVLAHYRHERPLPAISAGSPSGLPAQVTNPFELELGAGYILNVTPFTVGIPGLILYTVRVKAPRRPADQVRARQAVAVTSAEVTQVLVAARRDLQQMIEVQDAETRRLLIYAAVAGLLVAGALAGFALAGVALGPAFAGAAAAGSEVALGPAFAGAAAAGSEVTAGGLAGAELTAATGEVVSLAARRALSGVAVKTIAEVAPKIAASVTVYLGGRQFTVPPGTAGVCVEGGCDAGEAVTPTIPLR